MAGERFAVRNSGVNAVVEGVGDHACEYMTGGRVVVLGATGRNFAAGMSGGVAYVFDENNALRNHCNLETVVLEYLENDEDINEVAEMIRRHAKHTKSEQAERLLASWIDAKTKFVKVMPKDYRRMLEAIQRAEQQGLAGEEAIMVAFEENKNDLARVSGN